MKIGIVFDDTLDKPDGVQQAVITIGAWLRSEGHVVHYLVADSKRKDIPNIHSLGRFINLRYNKNTVRTPLPVSAKKIKALLSREQFDILHILMPCSPLLGEVLVRNASPDTAVIGTFHTLPASMLHNASHKALRLLLTRGLKRFDVVIGVSEPTVHFARAVYGLNAVYVPNPVVLSDYRTGRHKKEFDRRKLNILFLGRLVKRKGIIELVKAYNALDDAVADKTRLIICGKGPLRNKARELVAGNRNVTFEGFIAEKDKADYLATADIAVFPSTSGEAFGIVLIEAMAAGAGVTLGGSNPGYKSVLGAQPYLLFDPTDINGFAQHLTLFVEDKELRSRMHAWQQEAVKQYDISVVGKELMVIYEEALRSRRDVR